MADAGRVASPDYYTVLGVTRDISVGGLRNAYRAAARCYHPDRNPNDKAAADGFLLVKEAYDVLRNADTRRAYDIATDTVPPLQKRVRRNMRAAIRAYWRARYGLKDEER